MSVYVRESEVESGNVRVYLDVCLREKEIDI